MKDKKPASRGPGRTDTAESGNLQNEGTLGSEAQSKIGEHLRAFYDDVINQGVPDRFAELLKRLEEKGGGDRA
jgi:hypothetical protein